MTSDRGMRASDRDRDCTVEVLRDAYGVGRLDLDEFTGRTDVAYQAKTWGELHDLIADLPGGELLCETAFDAGAFYELIELSEVPRRPPAIEVLAGIWLGVATAARVVAVALALMVRSVFTARISGTPAR